MGYMGDLTGAAAGSRALLEARRARLMILGKDAIDGRPSIA